MPCAGTVLRVLLCPLPLFRSPGQARAVGELLARSCPALSLPPFALPQHSTAVKAEAASWKPEVSRDWGQPQHTTPHTTSHTTHAGGPLVLDRDLGAEFPACILWPKARGLPTPPSRQAGRLGRPTLRSRSCSWTQMATASQTATRSGGQRKSGSHSASAASRRSYCLAAGGRWQMESVLTVPSPKGRQP